MADLLEGKRLREERAIVATRICEIADKALAEKRDFHPDELENWTAANRDWDDFTVRIMRAENYRGTSMANLPGRGDIVHDPHIDTDLPNENRGASQIDLAIAGWVRTQAGMPIGDDLAAAVRSHGISPASGAFDIPLPRSRPRIGRDWFGRHEIERRALTTQVLAAGGALVPEGFVARFERALLDFGGMMQVAEVMTTGAGEDMPWPMSDDTGNEGELLGENAEIGEQDVAFTQMVLRAYKISSKLVRVSSELLQDSAVNLAGELGSMLGERIGRTANRLFTNGTGASQPWGIVNRATVGVTAASASAITSDEILNLIYSVDAAYRGNAKFMFNDATTLVLRKLKGGDGQYMWQPGLQAGQPDRLFGYEVVPNSAMPTIAASAKVVLFGDLSKYKIRMAGGVRMRRLVERYAERDQDGFVGFQRLDGNLLDAGTHPVKVLQMHA